MAIVPVRTRPLVAVMSRVPLFVEALAGAFDGIADVQAVSADDVEANGLVRAFRPDVVIIEGDGADYLDDGTPCVRVQLDTQEVRLRAGTGWKVIQVELSPEAIRNVAVAALYGGEPA